MLSEGCMEVDVQYPSILPLTVFLSLYLQNKRVWGWIFIIFFPSCGLCVCVHLFLGLKVPVLFTNTSRLR